MKARIEKKICKRLVQILPDMFKHAQVSSEPTDLAWEQGTSVSGMYYVGGGVDYWGEGEDAYSVLEAFWDIYDWCPPIFNPYPEGHELEGYPQRDKNRWTGKYAIACAKKIATHKGGK